MARIRHPTEEERALFHETFKDAKPLPKKRKRVAPKPVVKSVAFRASVAAPPPKLPVRPERDVPAIGGHRESHLRRGRIEPEARLDLHGLTQDAAHRALFRFLGRARSQDQRVVLVITGKGGVLRALVPRWLAEADFSRQVSGISPAHVRHGGGGAFYVALRRDKLR